MLVVLDPGFAYFLMHDTHVTLSPSSFLNTCHISLILVLQSSGLQVLGTSIENNIGKMINLGQ